MRAGNGPLCFATICAQLFASCVRGCSNQDRTTRAESLPVAQQRAREHSGKRSRIVRNKESPPQLASAAHNFREPDAIGISLSCAKANHAETRGTN